MSDERTNELIIRSKHATVTSYPLFTPSCLVFIPGCNKDHAIKQKKSTEAIPNLPPKQNQKKFFKTLTLLI